MHAVCIMIIYCTQHFCKGVVFKVFLYAICCKNVFLVFNSVAILITVVLYCTSLYVLCYTVIDDEDEQLSIVSKPGGGVALERYDMPFPPKGSVIYI